MAARAATLRKEVSCRGRIAGLFEETRRVKVGEQIRSRLLIEIARPDVSLAHGGPHRGRVVPHRGGQRRRREVAIRCRPRSGATVPPLPLTLWHWTQESVSNSWLAARRIAEWSPLAPAHDRSPQPGVQSRSA